MHVQQRRGDVRIVNPRGAEEIMPRPGAVGLLHTGDPVAALPGRIQIALPAGPRMSGHEPTHDLRGIEDHGRALFTDPASLPAAVGPLNGEEPVRSALSAPSELRSLCSIGQRVQCWDDITRGLGIGGAPAFDQVITAQSRPGAVVL